MGLSDQTTLERVRLRRARVDAPVARLRLSHLLASASLKPPAMPPSAILLVRAMADPLPGRISGSFAPGAIASAEWEHAARDSLGGFYGSAARPMWGPAPPDAPAVVFADYGELLACLAGDLASGAALGWWWQSILRRFRSRLPGSWSAVWAEHPLYIPAALEYLQTRQQAVKVLERIAPVQAWNLLTVVLRAFDLPGLTTTRGPTSVPPEPPAAAEAAARSTEAEDGFTQTAGAAALAASVPTNAGFPWEPYVPGASTPPKLGYQRQALLGIGLLLRRVPQAAFATAFGSRFRAWVGAAEAGDRMPAADLSRLHAASGDPPSRDSSGDGDPWHRIPARFRRPRNPVDGPSPAQAKLNQPAGRRRDPASADPIAPNPGQVRDSILGETSGRATDGVPSSRAQARDRAPAETTNPATDRVPPDQARVAKGLVEDAPSALVREWQAGEPTRAGGILYLIHFLRQAELVRHFDTGLGGWALLELLATCLLDDTPNLAGDSIWAALAHLDGRDAGGPPGSGFEPRRTYTAPASWLENAAGQSRFARFRSRGMEIWTGEGFLVLDSEEGERPSGALERLTRSRRRQLRRPARVRPVSLDVSPELRRFLHFVLPYARWRLGRALPGARLDHALLRAGRLYVTATHVDLVMPLKEISVPVRLAGLDANPGWVPELGRIVTFHFEQEGYSNG